MLEKDKTVFFFTGIILIYKRFSKIIIFVKDRVINFFKKKNH